jgi:hypothetical protein
MGICDQNFLTDHVLKKLIWAEFVVVLQFVFKKVLTFIAYFCNGQFIVCIMIFVVMFYAFHKVEIL